MRLFSAAALCAVLLITACSNTTDGDPGSSAPSPSNSPSVPPPSASVPSASSASSALTPALLSASEVGPGFTVSTPTAAADPLPCTPSKPPLETQVPSVDKAKALYANTANTLALQENLLAYRDAQTATRALSLAKAGLACTHGTVGGEGINIAGPNDVRSAITARVTAAYGWVVTTASFTGSIVVVQIGAKLVTLEFAAATQNAASSVDARQIIETAVAKAINGR